MKEGKVMGIKVTINHYGVLRYHISKVLNITEDEVDNRSKKMEKMVHMPVLFVMLIVLLFLNIRRLVENLVLVVRMNCIVNLVC